MCKLAGCPYEECDDEVQCELCIYNEIGGDSDFEEFCKLFESEDDDDEVMGACMPIQ